MKLFRRLKTKYGISHPLCVLSLLACLVLCVCVVNITLSDHNTITVSQSAGTVDTEQLSSFSEEIFDTVIYSYSQAVAIGIEPLLAVIIHGAAGLLNAMIGMPLNINNTVFSLPEVLMIAILLYSVGKLMQCFECTRSFTMITFGEFERLFGYAMLVTSACHNVVKIMYVCDKYTSLFYALFGQGFAEVAIALFVFWVGVITSFAGILIFYTTKTLVFGLQIMQLSISFFPFTSLLFEVLRSSVTVIMAVFNLLFPKMGFAFNCAAFILGLILLSQTSSSVEYFRVIYIESMLIPYYRYRGKSTALYKDVPTEIRKKCQNSHGMILPVFAMNSFSVGDIQISSHDKWWMEITDEGLFFYRKKRFSRKVESFYILKNDKKWYFKDNWRCLELFNLDGPEENIIRLFCKPEREIVFVVSREYETVFGEITDGVGATDYNALKRKLTDERRKYIEEENKAFYAITQ